MLNEGRVRLKLTKEQTMYTKIQYLKYVYYEKLFNSLNLISYLNILTMS